MTDESNTGSQKSQNLSSSCLAVSLSRTGILDCLIEASEAECLANLKVTTESGSTAQFRLLDSYPAFYFVPQAHQFKSETIDIGFKLDLTPYPRSDGSIVCKLEVAVSTLLDLVNYQYPRTRTRRTITEARLQDGETLVLGGLWREEDLEAVKALPWVEDLPTMGPLFAEWEREDTRSEIVVLVTPQVMR